MSVGTRHELTAPAPLHATRARLRRVEPELGVLAGLVVIGALLRFLTLGSQSYWYDEAQAAHELSLSFGAMVSAMISHESNPPLYFVVGWVWAKAFGTGVVGLRSLSALAGTAVIPVTYLGGRELVSPRAGLFAAALATVCPFMIWYSQEAREYMLLALLCGASLLYFARSLRRPTRRSLTLWALASGLAILTYSFAGFLVFAEALGLLYAVRTRQTALVVATVVVVQAALLPLLLGHASPSLLSFIDSTPLAMRIKQVPISFAFASLYQTSIVNYGLLGAAGLVAALILLLVAGAPRTELQGAGIAAGLAAVVIVVPLLLALAGVDYYLARALMPAWIPLAVVVGAACAAPRARLPGAALALLLLGSFIYVQAKIQSQPRYQRPDWRGVARALGHAQGPRAIVVANGLGTDPLRIYLPGVAWTPPSGAVTVDEVDVVGSPYQVKVSPLPAGTRMIGRRVVDGFLVDRFLVAPAWRAPLPAIAARGQALLTPATPGAPALLQSAVS
jgi:uncharacterized membrane protein